MKRYTLFIIACAMACLSANAQQYMRIWQNGESSKVTLADAQEMTFAGEGQTITIKGVTYNVAKVDSITLVHEVGVTWNENTATVTIPEAVKADVSVTCNGGDVVITNTNVANEIEFALRGTSSNGSFTYNGSYKATFILDGLNLTSKKGGAIDIECGKRIALQLVSGTKNTLVDAANGSQKACLYCKGHLEVEGSGSLSITGNAKHALATKEYLQLKKSTGNIAILKAASDAVHAGQYFQMNGGKLTFDSQTVGDGIQVETITLSDDVTPDPNEEHNGQVIIKGGTIEGIIVSQDCKAIKCDADVTISGGTITLTAKGNGSRGIQTDGNMTIGEEDNPTTITINADGARCTLPECSEDPHRCMGMKIEGNLTVTGGTTSVYNNGSKSRGIKLGGVYKKTGGTVNATIVQ